MATRLDELIHRADLDGLVRYVDDTCAARDWEHLVVVRDDAHSAISSGRQLWPITTLANFRLALWAPASQAARALDDSARTFMPGPVSEILAVHHSWDDLEPHIEHGHDRSLFAYERALRGDHIDSGEFAALDIPFAAQPWEPAYCLATYSDDGGSYPAPDIPADFVSIATEPSTIVIDDASRDAFRDLVEPWTAHSNGRAEFVCVDGGREHALHALGLANARVHELDHRNALQWLAWAGASGGAHGRRRGAATGRFSAWWLLAHVAGVADEWPVDPDEFGDIVTSLRYWWWDTNEPRTGWECRLVIVDDHDGVSCALGARDAV